MQNDNVKLKILLLVGAVLLVGNLFFAAQYIVAQKQLREAQSTLAAKKVNEKTLAFTQLFIEKVLKSETEVDFETRLQLENSVRDIGDEEIVTQWQKFTDSKTEAEAQKQVKNLLGILLDKIGI